MSPPHYGTPPPYGQQPPAPPGGASPGYAPFGGAPPKKKGMHGCLLAFLIALGVSFVIAVGVGIYLYITFKAFIGPGKEFVALMQEAATAPGTQEMRQAGCTKQAVAIDATKLQKIFNDFEREVAKKQGREPKPTKDLDKEAGMIVSCQVQFTDPLPTCDDIAKTYVDAAKPSTNIMVMVAHQNDKSGCSERYDSKGKHLGPASKVDLDKPGGD